MNNIILISKNTKYLKWYLSLVSKEYSNTTYSEKHHILPKSLGGTNAKINIVKIPGRVHFICHKLLVRMMVDTKHKKNMIHALNMLASANNKDQYRHQISSREYEAIRKQLSESMIGENNPMYGKPAPNRGITHTAETREKLSKANLAHYSTHPSARLGVKASEETRQKLRDRIVTDETRMKLSLAHKDKVNIECSYCGKSTNAPNYKRWHGDNCILSPTGPENRSNRVNKNIGQKRSAETKLNIGKVKHGMKHTDSTKAKISATLRKRYNLITEIVSLDTSMP